MPGQVLDTMANALGPRTKFEKNVPQQDAKIHGICSTMALVRIGCIVGHGLNHNAIGGWDNVPDCDCTHLTVGFRPYGLGVADSVDRIISIISRSLCRPDPVTSSTTPSQYASSGVSL